MRTIEGQLTQTIKNSIGSLPVDKAPPMNVNTFKELMTHTANLAYLNKDYLIFYRGQNTDYKTKSGASTFYPSIYRGDYLPAREMRYRFEILKQVSKLVIDVFKSNKIQGHLDVRRKKYIRWSIIQHYGICDTPLIDVTHSLRVACSFAQMESKDDFCFVYLFGLPYVTNRITINSEHDMVNVRLLSICPPAALRPYYQEGYLVGTDEVTTDYISKTELDLRNRLIAKFKIPSNKKFWNAGFSALPKTALYPKNDRIEELCDSIIVQYKHEYQSGDIGEFLQEWIKIEKFLIGYAKRMSDRIFSVREAVSIISKRKLLPKEVASEVDIIRRFRNKVVHKPETVNIDDFQSFLIRMEELWTILKKLKGASN